MSINAILGNALTGLNTSQSALRATSNNISNVNTAGYARTSVDLVARNVAGAGIGVEASQLRRISDNFLFGASLNAAADERSAGIRAEVLDRLQSQFGTPGDAGSLFSRLNDAFAEIGTAALDPASGVRRLTAVNDIQFVFDDFARLDGEVRNARAETERQISANVDRINSLIEQIQALNEDVSRGRITGDSTGAENRQAPLIDELAGLIDVKVSRTENGAAVLRTTDGVLLLGQVAITLEAPTTGSGSLSETFTPIQGRTPSGGVVDIQSHIKSGALHGLLALRDQSLPQLALELSELAASTADALNEAHSNASAVPPPGQLTGRNTGLLSTDALGFTGKTTLALSDSSGALTRRIDIDFDAGTLSVDGGAPAAFAATVGGIASALNTALGALGSASFTNGVLDLNAAAGNGLSFLQDGTTPSARAGRGFAHFFGLNALVTSAQPHFFETGLGGTDAHGLAAGGTLSFDVINPNGQTTKQVNITVAGTTINDILSALNNTVSGLGSFATFSLDSNGNLTSTPVSGAENYGLQLTDDTTTRGTTGVSFSQLFGLGDAVRGTRASAFAIRSDIANNPDLLSLAQVEVSASTAVGDIVLAPGDGRGGQNIQQALETVRTFQSAGALSGTNSSLSDFAARFAADIGARSSRAESESLAAQALRDEANVRRANVEGVNIDEELANLTKFQQSYNASARLIQAAKELTDTLLSII